jgi:hypothetical protein
MKSPTIEASSVLIEPLLFTSLLTNEITNNSLKFICALNRNLQAIHEILLISILIIKHITNLFLPKYYKIVPAPAVEAFGETFQSLFSNTSLTS